MKNNPRNLSVQILNRIEEGGAFAQPLLDSCLSKSTFAKAQDRGLLTQLVYGTLRFRNRLDWVIRSTYAGKFESMDTGLKNILRVALYQIMFADRLPVYAATNEAVKTAKKMFPGRSNLVNAILRNAARKMDAIEYPDFDDDPLLHISVLYSHPLWIVQMWAEQYGIEDTLALCKSNNDIPPVVIRANGLKTTRSDLLDMLRNCGCEAIPARYSPDGIVISNLREPVARMPLYEAGYMQIQDEASQMIALLLDPRPGERVLDLCAGVGIKTTHMAALMRNKGTITAMDINPQKIEMSLLLARRLGATNIEPIVRDAAKDPDNDLCGKFDRVLVDVPCSGMGTLRRNPEIKWNTKPEDMKQFPPLQKEILHRSAAYLKRGGIMVYSTCTIASAENEDVVREFLSAHPDFEYACPAAFAAGMTEGTGIFRTFPHRHGTDGFFGAVLQKKGKQP